MLVVAVPLARASHANKGRAEDWHRRAVVAEESVGGLRVVIVERSRELNQRTLQANRLAAQLQSNGMALRRSKGNVGALSRRQRQLVSANAHLAKERAELQSRVATLESIGAELSACAKAPPPSGKNARTVAAVKRSRAATCKRAGASFDAYLERRG